MRSVIGIVVRVSDVKGRDTKGDRYSSPTEQVKVATAYCTGFDRPLRARAHFERAVGRKVRVKTPTGRIRGEVLHAAAGAVQIRHGSETVDIPYDEIVRANLIDEGTVG